MSKIEEAQEILLALGLPKNQQNEMSALTLLALCDIKEHDEWKDAKSPRLGVSNGIMKFTETNYSKKYAANTRETFRRQVLHQFVQARVANYNPDIPDLPVNSPKAHYAISPEALEVITAFHSENWKNALNNFTKNLGKLVDKYQTDRKLTRIPVEIDEKIMSLSSGKHNEVAVAVIYEFAPRFAKNSKLLYLGDTENKAFYINKELFTTLHIPFDKHSKLPDLIFYSEEENWLYLIEVVTSHGPVNPKRIIELEELLDECKSGLIYVTAFPDKATFKSFFLDIAWETEVWIMDDPEHMIHLNGDRFFGPRK